MNDFGWRVVIGVGVWVLGEAVIAALIKSPEVKRIFDLTLLCLVVLFVFFGFIFPPLLR